MSKYRLQRFCDPDFLGQINPDFLGLFLSRFAAFFSEHGVSLDRHDRHWHALIQIFANPPEDTPDELVQALYYLDEVSQEEYRDHLAEVLWPFLSPDLSPPVQEWSTTDIAIKLWLENPSELERVHAKQLLHKQTGLEYYVVRHKQPPPPAPLNPNLDEAIAISLRLPLQTLQKGNAVRVFSFDRSVDACFVVNFGTAYQRAFKIENGETKAFGYRPVEHAVLYYSKKDGEAAIRANGVQVTNAVLQSIGQHLLGDKQVFVKADSPAKFTLEPLRTLGKQALACATCDDIATASLTEIRWGFGGGLNHKEHHTAADLFMAFEQAGKGERWIPHNARLRSATISFQQSRSAKARKVRLMPPNRASYDREGDCLFIEPWLRANGLVNSRAVVIETGSQSFWSAFEMLNQMSASKGEWRSRFNGCYQLLESTLVDDDHLAEIIHLRPPDSNEPAKEYRVMHHHAEGMVAVDVLTETKAIPIKKSQAAAWRLDARMLCEKLAVTLGIEIIFDKLTGTGSLWQVGFDSPMAGVRIPVFLAKPIDQPGVHAAIDRLDSLVAAPCILLLPTRRYFCGDVLERVRSSQVTCMILDEILYDVGNGGFAFTEYWTDQLEGVRDIVMPSDQVRSATFRTPAGATWNDVVIRFVDLGRERVSIKVKGVTGIYTFEGMGMANMRNGTPSKLWEFLKVLSQEKNGVLAWTSRQTSDKFKSQRSQLAKRLKEFFMIDDDPIPYDKAENGWRWKFTLQECDDPE